MPVSIDLNCDMGEEYSTDALIFPFISSVNIACGFHAGNEATIRKTIGLAVHHNVAIGAHPSYPDRAGFGRKEMSFSTTALCNIVKEQVLLVHSIALEMGTTLHHVKPHGALYNKAAKHIETAMAIAEAIKSIDQGLWLYGLSGSQSIAAAICVGLRVQQEVFADRTYTEDGMLTPRSEPGALIADEAASAAQVLQMINTETVQTLLGNVVRVKADTVCLHGDGPGAVGFAKKIFQTLQENRITVNAVT